MPEPSSVAEGGKAHRDVRKPNAENVYIARRTARFRRLVDAERVDELDAEYLISAWEQEAESRGLDRHSDRYWTEAEGWFAEQRRRA
jgi:hypothetical protein